MIELLTLGVVDLKDLAGRDLQPVLAQPKRLALLIYLAVANLRRLHRRDNLLALFWPDLDQEHARGALSQAVWFLRAHLGETVVAGRTEEELAVAAGVLQCDVLAFEHACEAGEPEQALALYRGDFLDGFYVADVSPEFEHWMEDQRGRLRQRAGQAAWTLAERSQRQSDARRAAEWARRAVAFTPDDEGEVRRLITLLEQMGDRVGALHAYADFALRLDQEFGASPSGETQALILAIRTRQEEIAPPPTSSAADIPVAASTEIATGPTAVPPARRRVRLAWGALTGVVLAGVLGISLFVRAHSGPPLDPNLVAVAPFEVLGPGLDLWRDGLVDVLSADLDGAGPLRTVPPTILLRHWKGRADAGAATTLGRKIGAGLVVVGILAGEGADSARLLATLIDVHAGNAITEVEARGAIDRMDQLADSLTLALLRDLGRSRPIGSVRLMSLGSHSLPALKAFLEGEQFYRRGEWDSAAASYERAIGLDSTFAIAVSHLGYALSWSIGPHARSETLALRAGALNHGLPSRDSLLIAADSQFTATGYQALFDTSSPARLRRLFATLDEATHRYPEDPEAWYELGEARHHLGPLASVPLREDLDAFQRSIALDSTFAPAYEHLGALTLLFHGPAAARRAVETYLAFRPRDVPGFWLTAQLLDGDRARAPEMQRLLDTAPAQALWTAASNFVLWPDSTETALRLARLFAAGPGSTSPGDVARRALVAHLALRGHLREAYQTIGPGEPWPTNRPDVVLTGQAFVLHLALLGAVPPDTAKPVFANWLRSGDWRAGLALPWWNAVNDVASERTLLRQAEDRLRRERLPDVKVGWYITRERAQAYLALARRDTVGALRRLVRVTDSLCLGCFEDRLLVVQLLVATGRNREAEPRLAGTIIWFAPALEPLWVLERARVSERLGNRDAAIAAYRYFANVWRHADPELQRYVGEARTALRRLGSQQQ
jgi:DNA-binding SARP family transcriptional activator/tetratricopeptide (TPR) repeat protein